MSVEGLLRTMICALMASPEAGTNHKAVIGAFAAYLDVMTKQFNDSSRRKLFVHLDYDAVAVEVVRRPIEHSRDGKEGLEQGRIHRTSAVDNFEDGLFETIEYRHDIGSG